MLPYRVCLVGVILALFLDRATSSSKNLVYRFLCGNIVLGPVPLEYLYWTGFDTCTVGNASIPVDCDHGAMHSQRSNLFALGQISCLDAFILYSFGKPSRPPDKVECSPSECICF